MYSIFISHLNFISFWSKEECIPKRYDILLQQKWAGELLSRPPFVNFLALFHLLNHPMNALPRLLVWSRVHHVFKPI